MRQDRNLGGRFGSGRCYVGNSDEVRGVGQGGLPWGGGQGRCWGGARNAGSRANEPMRDPGSEVRRSGLSEWAETIEKRMKALEERLIGTPPATP